VALNIATLGFHYGELSIHTTSTAFDFPLHGKASGNDTAQPRLRFPAPARLDAPPVSSLLLPARVDFLPAEEIDYRALSQDLKCMPRSQVGIFSN
jgi:hypothetical protein